MITQFYLKGFKSFFEPTLADITNLLVVAGSNSAGKSSLIQALLLLSQTLENPRPDVVLDLGGKYIQFAEFREAVYGRPKSTAAIFTLGFNLNILEDNISFDGFKANRLARQIFRSSKENTTTTQITNQAEMQIEFGADTKGTPLIKSTIYQKHIQNLGTVKVLFEKHGKSYKANWELIPKFEARPNQETILNMVENFPVNKGKRINTFITSHVISEIFTPMGFDLIDVPNIGPELNKLLNKTIKSKLNMDNFGYLYEIYVEICRYTFSKGFSSSSIISHPFVHFLMPTSSRLPFYDNESSRILNLFSNTFNPVTREIRQYIRNISYIGPLRAKPERAYLSTGTPLDIGNAGENAVPILWLNQNEKVMNKTKIGSEPTETKLVKATQAWLQEFELAYLFHITKPKRVIYQAEVESAPGSKTMVTIADVGFGVSQLLPVIIAGLRTPKGSTLILEQPEIHLHPKLQGKLADFLICMTELGIKVIVETHSEHLINMLRLRIVQDQTEMLKGLIGILFIRNYQQKSVFPNTEPEKVGAFIENLRADDYGKIINWPPDFFPEYSRLNEEILKAMIEKFPK